MDHWKIIPTKKRELSIETIVMLVYHIVFFVWVGVVIQFTVTPVE